MLKIFCAYDKIGQCYGMPNFFTHVGQCTRAFGDLIARRDSDIANHPNDFSIWQIGEFDQITGILTPIKPTHITEAAALVRKSDAEN